MRSVEQVPLPIAVKATIQVIDSLLAHPPVGLQRAGYVGNQSDLITGLIGVRVFYLTHLGLGHDQVVVNLRIEGPEPLLLELIKRYGGRFRVCAQGPKHLVFAGR